MYVDFSEWTKGIPIVHHFARQFGAIFIKQIRKTMKFYDITEKIIQIFGV